jgi:putative PIN family toxin of toxin-antitoxin system
MQKVIIDTNVLVSAIISRSYPYFIVGAWLLDKNIGLCVSDEVVVEYHIVLARKKFSKYHDFALRAENLLVSIDANATFFVPAIKFNILSDPDDNKFLELATTCRADFLITGNVKDFPMGNFDDTKIVTPKEYWENHR